MDAFSYLSVLLSVILGLAIAQILVGFRGLLLSRTSVKTYWPVVVWAVLILLACVQSWWAMFELRGRHDWTFPQFAIVLLQTIVTYMFAALIFPDFSGQGVVDLGENFFSHRGWFFGFGFASIVASVMKGVVLDGRLPHPADLSFHAVFGLIFLAGALAKRQRYQEILVVCAAAAFVLYITLLFVRLR